MASRRRPDRSIDDLVDCLIGVGRGDMVIDGRIDDLPALLAEALCRAAKDPDTAAAVADYERRVAENRPYENAVPAERLISRLTER
jgi:hypothetical protein